MIASSASAASSSFNKAATVLGAGTASGTRTATARGSSSSMAAVPSQLVVGTRSTGRRFGISDSRRRKQHGDCHPPPPQLPRQQSQFASSLWKKRTRTTATPTRGITETATTPSTVLPQLSVLPPSSSHRRNQENTSDKAVGVPYIPLGPYNNGRQVDGQFVASGQDNWCLHPSGQLRLTGGTGERERRTRIVLVSSANEGGRGGGGSIGSGRRLRRDDGLSRHIRTGRRRYHNNYSSCHPCDESLGTTTPTRTLSPRGGGRRNTIPRTMTTMMTKDSDHKILFGYFVGGTRASGGGLYDHHHHDQLLVQSPFLLPSRNIHYQPCYCHPGVNSNDPQQQPPCQSSYQRSTRRRHNKKHDQQQLRKYGFASYGGLLPKTAAPQFFSTCSCHYWDLPFPSSFSVGTYFGSIIGAGPAASAAHGRTGDWNYYYHDEDEPEVSTCRPCQLTEIVVMDDNDSIRGRGRPPEVDGTTTILPSNRTRRCHSGTQTGGEVGGMMEEKGYCSPLTSWWRRLTGTTVSSSRVGGRGWMGAGGLVGSNGGTASSSRTFSSSSSLLSSSSGVDCADHVGFGNTDDEDRYGPPPRQRPIRVAVIGGGIAGSTAAASIARYCKQTFGLSVEKEGDDDDKKRVLPMEVDIHVFEGDANAPSPSSCLNLGRPPMWTAASAKNANSMVPGASMGLLCQRSTLRDVARDTVREWITIHITERFFFGGFSSWWRNVAGGNNKGDDGAATKMVCNLDNFDVPPPYFDFHPLNCLGLTTMTKTTTSAACDGNVDVVSSSPDDERHAFLSFVYQFLSAAIFATDRTAKERSKYMVQLAQANRHLLLHGPDNKGASTTTMEKGKEVTNDGTVAGTTSSSSTTTNNNNPLVENIGLSHGFLAIYRSKAKAESTAALARYHGEDAEVIPWEQIIEHHQPKLRNLPMYKSLWGVYRPRDVTGSCEGYVSNVIRDNEEVWDVTYRRGSEGAVVRVESLVGDGSMDINHGLSSNEAGMGEVEGNVESGQGRQRRYRVQTADGTSWDTDVVVLAAGVRTPLLARQLGIGSYCPTYPLRGYSLTVSTANVNGTADGGNCAIRDAAASKVEGGGGDKKRNWLGTPFSIDAMYCSSVGPDSVRVAGFGEIVGFPRSPPSTRKSTTNNEHDDDEKTQWGVGIPSVAPRVLSRYATALIGGGCDDDGSAANDFDGGDARSSSQQEQFASLQCFRPMSPDDLPIVGEAKSMPGLFLHTGHGTLGWTLSIATAECLGQAVTDRLRKDAKADAEVVGGDSAGDELDKTAEVFELPNGLTMPRHVLSPDRFV